MPPWKNRTLLPSGTPYSAQASVRPSAKVLVRFSDCIRPSRRAVGSGVRIVPDARASLPPFAGLREIHHVEGLVRRRSRSSSSRSAQEPRTCTSCSARSGIGDRRDCVACLHRSRGRITCLLRRRCARAERVRSSARRPVGTNPCPPSRAMHRPPRPIRSWGRDSRAEGHIAPQARFGGNSC